jgi:hypothetical protein
MAMKLWQPYFMSQRNNSAAIFFDSKVKIVYKTSSIEVLYVSRFYGL